MTETTAALVLAQLALGRMGVFPAHQLYEMVKEALPASEQESVARYIIEHRKEIGQIVPDVSDKLVEMLSADLAPLEQRALREQEWCAAQNVRILTIDSPDYPDRMRHCDDAPLVLFVKGAANLNAMHVLNIVGTRKCTTYGQDFIAAAVRDIRQFCPDAVIVSGLAYGIDINAHRAALQNALPTIGVVAHGLDTLYPVYHRHDADLMIQNGGAVVPEYFTGTRPEARNFLQRNRIIAGMSDATIVVESASHGGGLVTARIAQEYGRDVFAVPGPVNAEYSKGCNNLIRDSKASLISSAEDIVNAMGWQKASVLEKARRDGIERSLFVELSSDEQAVVDALRTHGDSPVNHLAIRTTLTVSKVATALFALEMKGMVKALPGNVYHLIGEF